ncbi:SusC/RagA family TonB-linked outer membrane protein [Chishuiella sp.]|uniref:SusC/RagA family TonB-linked outer membrane protein n=1 Tax=Chishuiella sp. TaxID=1969467 RepID=UPI0028AEFEE7|nr:SusC/RagA family TonB-linked outer membrane protein [Chishuiella sp.]
MRRNLKNLFVLGGILLGSSLYAQDVKTVTGVVTDSDGLPVADAVVKSTSGAEVYTDEKGSFSIEAKQGDLVTVESVGLPTQTFTVGTQKEYKVSLKPTETVELEGAVVTALGIKRDKKSLGFASQEVKAGELSDGTTNTGNIAAQLSGKVAGLNVTTTSNFGGSANLVIRGIKSVEGSSPLIVIDGSPVNNSSTYGDSVDYGNALSDINQEDIESINVLKGAAASALYGERGLNGVIVITTKSGKGGDDGSWGVTLNTAVQVGSIDKSTFPKYQKKYGGGYDMAFYTEKPAIDGNNYANFSEDASWGPKFDPNQLVYQWDSFDPSSPNYGKATPWVAAKNGPITFFQTPVTYNNTVTMEKGDKNKNFSFTYDNMYSDGLMPNSNLNKNTFSLKSNFDLTDRLHATVYSTLTIQNTRGRNTTDYSDNIMTGFRQWWQTNVDVKSLERAYFNNRDAGSKYLYGNVTWNRQNSTSQSPAFWNNPYFQAYENYSSDQRNRSFSYAQVRYDVSKNFNILGKVSYDRTALSIDNRLAVGSLAQTFGISGKNVTSGYSRQDITQTETNYDIMGNYNFSITDDINVSGVVGANLRRNYYNSIYASTEGGLVVPKIYSLANSAQSVLAPVENVYTTQTNSGYATASFDFYKIFYLDATWRIANSSTLPNSDDVFNYPSITGALIMSEIIKAPWLSFWKLRGNYAEVGGTANPYQLVNYYNSSGIYQGSNGGVTTYSSITDLSNPDLKPQRSKEFEFGTEASFFKNRLTFDFAYYKTKTVDQLIMLPVSSGSGYLKYALNAGQINNEGYEVQLGGSPIKTKDFTWDINLNWAKNQNKVVSLTEGVDNYLLDSYQGGVSLNARVGQAWGTLVGSDYVYLNGQKVVDPETGRYEIAENQVIGNATPKWTAGIRNSFSYKGVSLSFLIDIRHGGDIFSTDMYYGLATGLYPETAVGNNRENGVVLPGVNPDGSLNTTVTQDPTEFGSQDGYSHMPNKRFVYDGSYIKLREASIGYTIPKKVLNSNFIKDAKISLVGRNLWIIQKNLPYADPENMLGGGLRAYGYSVGSMPTTRQIGVNVTFKF